MIRAFLAVPLPDQIRDALERLQSHIRVGRALDPDSFHITLAFLDDQPEQVLACLDEELSAIKQHEFSVTISGVNIFGGNKPRLVWAGVAPNRQLSALREKVRTAAAHAGIELKREKFRPHITLSRVRGVLRGDEPVKLQEFLSHHAGFRLPPFPVAQIALYQSILHEDGATHHILAEYPFN